MSSQSRRLGVFIILWSLGGLLVCASAFSREEKLVSRKYPEGFSLLQPQGWGARLQENKFIYIAGREGAGDSAFILVYPFFLKTPFNSRA